VRQPELARVVDVVVSRARDQGYVLPWEVRAELDQAGLPEGRWKEVLAQAGPALTYQHGRYYFAPPPTAAAAEHRRRQQQIHAAIRRFIRHCHSANSGRERRGEDRVDFIQPVEVQKENGETLTLLSRDLSLNGIRLLATHSLLGKKIRVLLTGDSPEEACGFLVCIVWTGAVGSGLYENGGVFLEAISGPGRKFRVVGGE
jgi:hypothetical protein